MAPKRSSFTSRTIVIALVPFLASQSGLAMPASATEVGQGSISGSLYQADGRTGLSGARIVAISVNTGQRYVGVTGKNGAFEVFRLPASTYNIEVETGGQVFVGDSQVDVGPGQSVSLSYALDPMRPAGRAVSKMTTPTRSATQAATEASSGAGPFWTSPEGLALIWLISAGASIALFSALEDNEASPSSP